MLPDVSESAAAARRGRERRPQEARSVRAGQQRAADRSSAAADQRAAAAAAAAGFGSVERYLRQRYVAEVQPLRVLVAELGVSKGVVLRLMDRYGVGRRGPGPA